jgi:hypothetical protein
VNAFRKYAGPRCRAIALSQNPDGTGGTAVTMSTLPRGVTAITEAYLKELRAAGADPALVPETG